MLVKFISRLLDRGHTIKELTPLLLQAASTLDRQNIQLKENNKQSTIYIHWTYHPNGLQQRDLRRAFDTTLNDTLPYNRK